MVRSNDRSRQPGHQIEIEVRYAETDQMGVVHHANYLIWFELARTALCERSGHRYVDIEKRGLLLMVTGLRVDYREPARYGDRVKIHVWVEAVRSRILHFGYEARRIVAEGSGLDGDTSTGPLLARAITEHTWVDAATRRVCRVPKELESAFRAIGAIERPVGADPSSPD